MVAVAGGAAEDPRRTNNHFTEMCVGTEAGSYFRRIDSCITQLKAQGPARTCNESKEEDLGAEVVAVAGGAAEVCFFFFFITLQPRVE